MPFLLYINTWVTEVVWQLINFTSWRFVLLINCAVHLFTTPPSTPFSWQKKWEEATGRLNLHSANKNVDWHVQPRLCQKPANHRPDQELPPHILSMFYCRSFSGRLPRLCRCKLLNFIEVAPNEAVDCCFVFNSEPKRLTSLAAK